MSYGNSRNLMKGGDLFFRRETIILWIAGLDQWASIFTFFISLLMLALAGSETQVMSLWQVSDYVSQRLMKAYNAGLKQGQGRGGALRRVKLEMMRRQGTGHPFYRAGFIPSGRW